MWIGILLVVPQLGKLWIRYSAPESNPNQKENTGRIRIQGNPAQRFSGVPLTKFVIILIFFLRLFFRPLFIVGRAADLLVLTWDADPHRRLTSAAVAEGGRPAPVWCADGAPVPTRCAAAVPVPIAGGGEDGFLRHHRRLAPIIGTIHLLPLPPVSIYIKNYLNFSKLFQRLRDFLR